MFRFLDAAEGQWCSSSGAGRTFFRSLGTPACLRTPCCFDVCWIATAVLGQVYQRETRSKNGPHGGRGGGGGGSPVLCDEAATGDEGVQDFLASTRLARSLLQLFSFIAMVNYETGTSRSCLSSRLRRHVHVCSKWHVGFFRFYVRTCCIRLHAAHASACSCAQTKDKKESFLSASLFL